MSRKKISEREIKAIKLSDLTVREAAIAFQRSPTTIVKIRKGRMSAKAGTRKPDHRGLSRVEEVVFTEAARFSRYTVKELCEFLAPVFHKLPTVADRKQKACLGNIPKKISDKTLNRILNRANLKSRVISGEHTPGTVAIHRFPVSWPKKNDTGMESAELLCLLERFTGTVFLKAYRRVGCGAVDKCLTEFNSFSRLAHEQIVFVGNKERWLFRERRNMTNKGEELLMLPDVICADFFPNPKIIYEEFPEGSSPSELVLNTPFATIGDLNAKLIKLVNKYLFSVRFDGDGDESDRFVPAARHWAAYQCEENVEDYGLRPRILDRKRFERMIKIKKDPRLFKADAEQIGEC